MMEDVYALDKQILPHDEKGSIGYQFLKSHPVFYIKIKDFIHKTRLVVCSCITVPAMQV